MCDMCKPAIGTGYVLGMPQDCNLAKRVNEVKSSGVESVTFTYLLVQVLPFV
jgi:hypothetical protein